MKIAIVDDGERDRATLKEGIERFLEKNGIAGNVVAFEQGSRFVAAMADRRPDVVFLDIYMNGMDGMETARRIRERDKECLIIFTTTSKEHAVESFRVRAFDYLVKPYTAEQLEEVLRLCLEAMGRNSKYIEVVSKRAKLKILLKDIIFSDVDGHYIMIHTKTEVIKTRMQFDQFSPLLLSDKRFLNCYRNCIINMDEVGSMEEFDFLMKGGERIPITKARANALKEAYANYVFEQLHKNA